MYRTCKALALAMLLLSALELPSGAELLSQPEAESQARDFLVQLDQGLHDESWRAMSPLFKALNKPEDWNSRQQVIRTVYGPLASRSLSRVSYRKAYSLSPDGNYILVQFHSSYQNRTKTAETVVLECDTGANCAVREYIIQ